jgi:hypothetical protein
MALVNITAIPRSTVGWHSGNAVAHRRGRAVGEWGLDPSTADILGERFLERFLKYFSRPDGECWLWTAGVDAYGYGQIARNGGRGPIKAHRAAWILAHGPITRDQHVLHRCDVTRCVNPDHLFLGDQDANMKDAAAKGRLSVPHRRGWSVPESVIAAIVAAPAVRGSGAALARQFGVSKGFVSLVRKGKRRAAPARARAVSGAASSPRPQLLPSTAAEGQA